MCLSRRFKQTKSQRAEHSYVNYNHSEKHNTEVLEVNWDEINNHYKETNLLPLQLHSDQRYNSSTSDMATSYSSQRISNTYSEQRSEAGPLVMNKPDGAARFEVPHSKETTTVSKPDGFDLLERDSYKA